MSQGPAEGLTTLPELLHRLLARASSLDQAVDAVLDLVLAIGAERVELYLQSGDELRLAGERSTPSPVPEPPVQVQRSDQGFDDADRQKARNDQSDAGDVKHDLAFELPLTVEDEPVGILSVRIVASKSIDDRKLVSQSLASAAPAIAVALQHAERLDASRRREQDQAMLTAASRRFNSTLELETILNDVARTAAQEIGDFGIVLVIESDKPELTVAAASDRSPAITALRQAILAKHPLRTDRGPLAEVVHERKVVTLTDPDATVTVQGLRVAGCLAVPILYRGEELGVLVVGMVEVDAGERRISDRECSLTVGLADSVAPAIYHGGLFRTVAHEEYFLRSVLDNLPEAVLIIEQHQAGARGTEPSAGYQFSILNLAAQELFGERLQAGTSFKALLTANIIQTSGGAPLDPSDNLFTRAFRGQPSTGQELLVSTASGVVTVLASTATLHDRDGRATAVVAIMQDITEQRELEKNKDAFLAVAAHELRSPLTNLRGQLQLLGRQSKDLPEHLRQRVASADHAAQQMSDLAIRLLDVSRIGLGRLEIERAPFELTAMIRELVEEVIQTAPRLGSQHITLALPDSPVTGSWDRQRLQEVLTNLIENAARYGAPDGVTRVELIEQTATENQVIISVHDDGPGIDSEFLPHLFERYGRYWREEQRTSQRSGLRGGLGLGLFISKSIVEAHGGSISVDSPPGQGTTFTITLPRT